MAEVPHKADSGIQHAKWVGLAKVLGLLLLVMLFFLLAQSMVEHHFFTGGAQDYHNSPTGP
jgi:hypothetical protein